MTSNYSRDTAVEAVRAYYRFLATIPAFPESAILEPPAGCWPNITAKSLSALNQDEAVIELLRHLPCIEHRRSGNSNISYDTILLNYNDDMAHDSDNKVVGGIVPYGAGELPSHVAVLTMGGRYGGWLLLDTHEGTRVWKCSSG